jgi:hypothetical protein
MTTYYKTKITFNVLSQDPIPDGMNLDEIYRECIDGAYSGDLGFITKVTKLNAEQAARELMKQGSDPEFFGIEID